MSTITRARRDTPNAAPSQWGRRLARAVGEQFGVQMSPNHARNEGEWRARAIVIKCAKSTTPPISVLATMLERLDEVWAVFVLPSGEAEIWSAPAKVVRAHGHLTRGSSRGKYKVSPRVEITRRRLLPHAQFVGMVPKDTVDECRIP